jgi:hypothetical protein
MKTKQIDSRVTIDLNRNQWDSADFFTFMISKAILKSNNSQIS